MSFWSNLGTRSCQTGQRYSELLQMCVAEDAQGAIAPTSSGNVAINDQPQDRPGKGQFWDKAPEYISSIADLWGAIKGHPVQQNGQGQYNGQYTQQKDDSNTALIGVVMVMVGLLIVVVLLRRKK